MVSHWDPAIHNRELKEQICEIGRRIYNRGFAAANDGNISVRVSDNVVLCTPTMICKGFMTPDDICAVDMEGNQIAGKRKRTSEILLHLTIMKHRPDVKAVVHCHPPHVTAFSVAGEPIPQCVLPEVEIFMGEIPIAPYATPGTEEFANTVLPFLKGTNTIVLKNHGTVSFDKSLEEAYWKTEILDAYCRILLLARQLGRIEYFGENEIRELLELKQRLGFDDPRFHAENCDLCGNSAFREGYKEKLPEPQAFPPPPSYSCRFRQNGQQTMQTAGTANVADADLEPLVQAITDQVLAALNGGR